MQERGDVADPTEAAPHVLRAVCAEEQERTFVAEGGQRPPPSDTVRRCIHTSAASSDSGQNLGMRAQCRSTLVSDEALVYTNS